MCLLVLVFGLGFGAKAEAATYYIDYEGGSDSNNGTSTSTPWQHVPGDSRFSCSGSCSYVGANGPNIFIFKGGVAYLATNASDYLVNITHSGSGMGSERIYDGNSAGNFGSGRAIINLNSLHYNAFYSSVKSYGIIRNFEIYGMKNPTNSTIFSGDALCGAGLYRVNRGGIDQCVAYSGSGTNRNGAMFLLGGSNWSITNNLIHDSQDHADLCIYSPETDGYSSSISSVPSDQTGIQITNNAGANPISDVIISNNEIYNVGRDAVTLVGVTRPTITNNDIGGSLGQGYFSVAIRVSRDTTDATISGNEIHDGWQYQGDDSQIRCHAGDWIHIYGDNDGTNELSADPNDINIEKNNFYSDRDFAYGNGTGVMFIEEDAFNITFRNNLVTNPFKGIMTQNYVDQLYFFNNTIISWHDSFPPLYIGLNTGNNVSIKNNIFINYTTNSNVAVGYHVYDATDVPESSNNIFYKPNESTRIISRGSTSYTLSAWQSLTNQEPGSLVGDPELASIPSTGTTTSSGNFALLSGSSAKNAGTDLSATFSTDFAGTSRPQGSAWDIGAYEYVASSSKAISFFDFNGLSPAVTGTVNEGNHTIALTVPYGTNITSLVPTITITGSSVAPNTGVAQNFTDPITYTVTAEDASTQEYVVTVIIAPDTSENPDGSNDNNIDDGENNHDNLDISNVKYSVINGNQIKITFKTNNYSKGIARFGTDKNLKQKEKESKNKKKHTIKLKNIIPGAKYYFRISAEDKHDQSERTKIYSVILPTTTSGLSAMKPRPGSGQSAGKPETIIPTSQNQENQNPAPQNLNQSQTNENTDRNTDNNTDTTVNNSPAPQSQPQKSNFKWYNPFTWF